MTIINVRHDSETSDNVQIVFGKDGERIEGCTSKTISIREQEDGMGDFEIYISDIDYLIKALRKAKEVFVND